MEEPLPYHADTGHRRHRARPQSGPARRAHQDRLRDEPAEAAGLDPAGAGGGRARADQLRARADDHHVLHEPGGAAERAGRPDSSAARLQDGAHPQGRPRRLDQRAPAGRGEVGAAVGRARALQEPVARRHRAAAVQAGRGHLQGRRRGAGRGFRDPRGHGRDPPQLRRGRAGGEPDRRRPAARRDGGLPRGARRSATAVAAEDVELLVIKEERLEWLVRNRPQLALELLKRLSNLVVATDQERAQAHAGGVIR